MGSDSKPKTGRPFKLTEDRIERAAQALAAGVTKEVAARHAGLGESTCREYLAKARAIVEGGTEPADADEALMVRFLERMEEAETAAELRLSGLIAKAAETDWKAAAWILPRRHPGRWSEKAQVELTGADGGPVEVETSGVLANIGAFVGPDDVSTLEDGTPAKKPAAKKKPAKRKAPAKKKPAAKKPAAKTAAKKKAPAARKAGGRKLNRNT